jgi:hypothetical protein
MLIRGPRLFPNAVSQTMHTVHAMLDRMASSVFDDLPVTTDSSRDPTNAPDDVGAGSVVQSAVQAVLALNTAVPAIAALQDRGLHDTTAYLAKAYDSLALVIKAGNQAIPDAPVGICLPVDTTDEHGVAFQTIQTAVVAMSTALGQIPPALAPNVPLTMIKDINEARSHVDNAVVALSKANTDPYDLK